MSLRIGKSRPAAGLTSWRVVLAGLALLLSAAIAGRSNPVGSIDTRVAPPDALTGLSADGFLAYDVIVDAGASPLAAYQLDARFEPGNQGETVHIVGVEGGQPGPFEAAPFFDPTAIQGERVLLAAYSTKAASELPSGAVRVARIHVMIEGREKALSAPRLSITLTAAGGPEGGRFAAAARFELAAPATDTDNKNSSDDQGDRK